MAEAAVEERPHPRFYCHLCNVHFNGENASPNFTCPHCAGGFIEELPPAEPEASEDEDEYNVLDYEMELPDFFLTPGPPEERQSGRSRHPDSRRRRTLPRLPSSVNQHSPFDNLIQEVIVNLGVGVNWGGGGNMQLFLGNPGDYAWGREGLDAIVTQLLNQMDCTGPPPLSKEVIDALPLVEVNDQHVESKAQCSVCWEDFVVKEGVRQLPCQHIYHEPCIRPWLELHGTCPICRQNLAPNDSSHDGNQTGNPVASGGAFNAFHNLLWNTTGHRSNSPSSSTATRGSDSPTSSNSSSSNRDSRM